MDRSNHTTIAVRLGDIEQVRTVLESQLDVAMDKVASGAWGDYYATPNRPPPVISVFQNMKSDDEGPYWNEEEYREYPLLISISNAATIVSLNSTISKILSDPRLEAVLVFKEFIDNEGNVFDEHGNLIRTPK